MIELFQKRKVFKGIRRLCSSGLIRFKRACADHSLDLAAAIRAVATRSLIKRALAQEYIEILRLQLFACKIHAEAALCRENPVHLIFGHCACNGRNIIAALVSLMRGKCLVLEKHLPRRAIAFFVHAAFIVTHGLQQLTVLRISAALAVRAESSALRQVQHYPCKLFPRDCFIERPCAQGINVLQLPIKQRIELFMRNKPARYDQIAYTFVAVSVSSQSAPRTARLSSRCRERRPSLWVLRPGENARTKIEYAAGVFVRI